MKNIQNLVLHLLFLILGWFIGRPPLPPLPSSSLDHYEVVFTWAPSFCAKNPGECISDYGEDFYLLGIWPKDKDGGNPPINHSIDHDLEQAISKLNDSLSQAWPPLSVKWHDHDEFWRHEWEEHGRHGNMVPEEYFKKAIDVRNAVDLKRYLSSAVPSITPDQTTTHMKDNVENAIKEGRRRSEGVYITCRRQEQLGKLLLHNIHVCLNIFGRYASCAKRSIQGTCLYPPKPVDANIEPSPPPLSSTSLQHYEVVFTWAPSFCAKNPGECISDYGEDFYLLSIWPKDKDGQIPPINHSLDHDPEQAISKLKDRLSQAWPPLSVKWHDLDEFWRHEWEEHGRHGNMVPEEYFKTAIDVRNAVDLKGYLRSAVPSITPDQTTTHMKDNVENAIKRGRRISEGVYITCRRQEQSVKLLLYNISVCLDIFGQYASCPKRSIQGTCLYPPKPKPVDDDADAKPSPPPLPSSSLHHYKVVFTWAPSFCAINPGECISDYGEDFYLRGIWPMDKDGENPPINHSVDHDLEQAISKLNVNLSQAWPPLSVKWHDLDEFWRHEWEEHGRHGNMVPEEYFKKAIDVRNAVDLKGYLSSAVPSITPHQSKTHLKSDIKNAIKEGRRRSEGVYIACRILRGTRLKYLLYDIHLCLDIFGKYASCPKHTVEGTCLYPPKPIDDDAAFVGAHADAYVE